MIGVTFTCGPIPRTQLSSSFWELFDAIRRAVYYNNVTSWLVARLLEQNEKHSLILNVYDSDTLGCDAPSMSGSRLF